MRDWVSFAEIKSQVKLAAVLCSYGVDWLRRSGPPQQYRGRCSIHGGQGTEAFHAQLERGAFHCFACGAAMLWTSWRRWKAALCERPPYGCKGLRTQAASPLGCRRGDPGEGNWLRKKEKSTRP